MAWDSMGRYKVHYMLTDTDPIRTGIEIISQYFWNIGKAKKV